MKIVLVLLLLSLSGSWGQTWTIDVKKPDLSETSDITDIQLSPTGFKTGTLTAGLMIYRSTLNTVDGVKVRLYDDDTCKQGYSYQYESGNINPTFGPPWTKYVNVFSANGVPQSVVRSSDTIFTAVPSSGTAYTITRRMFYAFGQGNCDTPARDEELSALNIPGFKSMATFVDSDGKSFLLVAVRIELGENYFQNRVLVLDISTQSISGYQFGGYFDIPNLSSAPTKIDIITSGNTYVLVHIHGNIPAGDISKVEVYKYDKNCPQSICFKVPTGYSHDTSATTAPQIAFYSSTSKDSIRFSRTVSAGSSWSTTVLKISSGVAQFETDTEQSCKSPSFVNSTRFACLSDTGSLNVFKYSNGIWKLQSFSSTSTVNPASFTSLFSVRDQNQIVVAENNHIVSLFTGKVYSISHNTPFWKERFGILFLTLFINLSTRCPGLHPNTHLRLNLYRI